MKILKIKKRNGSFRTVVVPSKEQKATLRELGTRVAQRVSELPTAHVVHGFSFGRSPVTNAKQHIGYNYTVSFDLADFFDTVTEEKLRGKMSVPERTAALYEGRAAQGLPSSPAISNLAAADMDAAILGFLKEHGINAVYTRYADDLTFSFNTERMRSVLLAWVPLIIEKHGFKVNPAKTHCQSASAGYRIITGVAVTDTEVRPTRETKRRLRAAKHQNHAAEAQGLAEWAACKLPRAARHHCEGVAVLQFDPATRRIISVREA